MKNENFLDNSQTEINELKNKKPIKAKNKRNTKEDDSDDSSVSNKEDIESIAADACKKFSKMETENGDIETNSWRQTIHDAKANNRKKDFMSKQLNGDSNVEEEAKVTAVNKRNHLMKSLLSKINTKYERPITTPKKMTLADAVETIDLEDDSHQSDQKEEQVSAEEGDKGSGNFLDEYIEARETKMNKKGKRNSNKDENGLTREKNVRKGGGGKVHLITPDQIRNLDFSQEDHSFKA